LYEVRLSRAASKALDRLPNRDFQRISRAIDSLAANPRPTGASAVKGTPLLRVRVGDYRIVYQVDDAGEVIVLVKVTRRDEHTYKGL
jgi:mRNA interferase RelE/StbE